MGRIANTERALRAMLDLDFWQEPATTRCCWITLLVMADDDGRVVATDAGIARRAVLTEEEVSDALGQMAGLGMLTPISEHVLQMHPIAKPDNTAKRREQNRERQKRCRARKRAAAQAGG